MMDGRCNVCNINTNVLFVQSCPLSCVYCYLHPLVTRAYGSPVCETIAITVKRRHPYSCPPSLGTECIDSKHPRHEAFMALSLH